MLSPQQIAAKWQQRLSSASQAYTDGINSVTESPMAKAAANAAGYVAGVTAAVNSGKWQSGLNRVDLNAWKSKATTIGAQRLSSGAAAGQPKMQSFLTQFLPFLQNNVSQIKAMPNTNLEDRINRMVAMARLNAQFKRTS